MSTAFRTEVLKLEDGERFPLLIERATGLPDPYLIRYSLAYHRKRSINTSSAILTAIGLFKDWLNLRNINLEQRVGSGDLFSAAEVEALAAALRESRSKGVDVNGQSLPGVVIGDTHVNRVQAVSDYIKWRVAHVVQAMPAADSRVLVANQRLDYIREQLASLASRGGGRTRLGLTEDQQVRLFEIVRPGSALNPFHEETQHRNYVLFLIYYELGVRRAEPLTLKSGQVHTSDPVRPRLTIRPLPNDPDEKRKRPPLVKTAGRVLPISSALAQATDDYVQEHRSKIFGAKRSKFIFLAADGKPDPVTREAPALSLDAVYDMFVVIRKRFPAEFPKDFSPHVLRHTWNDRFKRKARELGFSDAKAKLLGNYAMGWSKTSLQSSNYGQLETQRQAEEILLALQSQMIGLVQ